MAQQEHEDERLRRYLLGTLPAREQMLLEDAYLTDDELFEQLNAVEAELVDAYVMGELQRDDRVRFEERYLGSPEQRQRVAFARQLHEPSDKSQRDREETPSGWWARNLILPARRQPLLVSGVAAAVLTIAVSVGWLLHRPATVPERPPRAGRPPASAASSVPKPKEDSPQTEHRGATAEPIALVLVPGTTRAPGEGAVLTVARDAQQVRIRLVHDGEGYASYRAVLRTPEGRDIWHRAGLTPERPGTASVVITLPRTALRPGTYVITLSGTARGAAPEDVADYVFRIVSL